MALAKVVRYSCAAVVLSFISLFPSELWAQCASCNVQNLTLPGRINISQAHDGVAAFASVTVSGASSGTPNATYLGWCIERTSPLLLQPHDVSPYSTYNVAVAPFNTIPWGKVNWILNNKTGYSPKDVQDAIWMTLGDPPPDASTGALALYAAAASKEAYVPPPNGVVAILLSYYGYRRTQETIIEVPVPECGVVGDFVWYDANRNGVQDVGESGINGVPVTLKNASGQTIATTVTGAPGTLLGQYRFSGLCQGNYTVEVATPVSMQASQTGGTSNIALDSNGSPAAVYLPTDRSQDLTIDFGYHTPCTGAIGDLVWNDQNRNGIQDVGEPGVNSVTVTLRDAGNTVLATTATKKAWAVTNSPVFAPVRIVSK